MSATDRNPVRLSMEATGEKPLKIETLKPRWRLSKPDARNDVRRALDAAFERAA